jgi:hypothetical protein
MTARRSSLRCLGDTRGIGSEFVVRNSSRVSQ